MRNKAVTRQTYAVILAGGRGERFWPLSTSKHPKQVLRIVSDKPLLAMAVDYLKGLIPPRRIFVITSADLASVIARAVPSLPRGNIIGEPFGRDTAAAVALGCALVQAREPNGVFCVLTADHVMGDLPAFRRTLSESFALAAARDVLITIGMQPTYPATGFGYIESGERLDTGGAIEFRSARRFVEKPNHEKAAEYVASGRFFWNAGMFIWSVASLRKALGAHAPALLGMADRMLPAVGKKTFGRRLAAEYGKLEKISVDYALMEKARNIVMARGTFPWDDVGSWRSLENHFAADPDGNVKVGRCEALDARGNIVFSRDRLTALIGVENLVVVQADGATLVCPKDRVQDVKQLVKRLEANKALYRELL